MYRAIQKLPLIGAVIASSLLASCSEEVRMHSPTAESVVEIGFEGRTTSGAIATNNLSSQVSGREATARLRPADMDALGRLVDILLKRTQYLGTYSDFQRAVQVAKQAMARSEGSDAAKLISARVDSALHRFDSARETLESLGRVTAATIRLESTIGLALNNDLEPLAENRRTDAHQYPNYQTLSALAAAESALGHYDLADGLYVRALQSYGDVSPFPVAWVQFQRGVMWAEAADQPERALPLYREAVARLPGYVVANVHLAELESQMGQMDQAIERHRGCSWGRRR
jgi:tetratricopeptide (TPR) repeat protein